VGREASGRLARLEASKQTQCRGVTQQGSAPSYAVVSNSSQQCGVQVRHRALVRFLSIWCELGDFGSNPSLSISGIMCLLKSLGFHFSSVKWRQARVIVQACNPSTPEVKEAKAGRLGFPSQPGLHSERPNLKKAKRRKRSNPCCSSTFDILWFCSRMYTNF
jgi:hypothetical protein